MVSDERITSSQSCNGLFDGKKGVLNPENGNIGDVKRFKSMD